MNSLLKYLNMELVNEEERFIFEIPKDIKLYNTYIQDCIKDILNVNPNIKWQKCTKCNNYYPYHINFFKENLNGSTENNLYTLCRNCSKDIIKHFDNALESTYKNYGVDIYNIYKNHNPIEIYKHWRCTNRKNIPSIINNENDKLTLVKYCYDQDMFRECDEIICDNIKKICGFSVVEKGLIKKINKEIFGIEVIDTIDAARKIFFNYLLNKSINYNDNIYDLKYGELIKKCNLRGYLKRKNDNDLLGLVMDLYDNKYPAYKFNIQSIKYWVKQEHRDKALKYLIEEDMKLGIEKIPLYLTLTSIRNIGTNTMYNVLKKYYKSIWEWVNEIYPNKFIERDFNINIIRNDFDSIEEMEIHSILKSNFNNVLYNTRNTENTIVIDGMIPDWFIFTDEKCYIVEYFGISVDTKKYNSRIEVYQNKMLKKLDKYKNIKLYGKIFLYPEDLKHNYKELKNRLKEIV